MKTMTYANIALAAAIVCLVASLCVAVFWYAVYRIRENKGIRERKATRKAILEALKDGPLERGKILDWLEDQGICSESDGDYEIDNLLGSDLISENEEPRYTKDSVVIIDDDEQVLEITTKGKQKLQAWSKK